MKNKSIKDDWLLQYQFVSIRIDSCSKIHNIYSIKNQKVIHKSNKSK